MENKFKTIIKASFLILVLGAILYQNFKPEIDSMKTEIGINKYDEQIQDCVENKKAETNSKAVGLEYTCAIDIASDIYADNEEDALELCMAYNPLNTDASAARIACELSINERIEKAEPEIETQNNETTQSQFDNHFVNSKYKYSLSLNNSENYTNDDLSEITILDKNNNFLARIKVLDPTIYSSASTKLQLRDYVEYISELNTENLDLPIQESGAIGGISGYTISTFGSFRDDFGEYTFASDFPVHAFTFISYNGMIYQFEIPESLGHPGRLILDSIRFE